LRQQCSERIVQRDEMLDIGEDIDETFNAYSVLIWTFIDSMDHLLCRLRSPTGEPDPSSPTMRLKLLQLIAEQLGRERAFVSGHLVRPETLRLAAVVRKLAEVIGARKVLLGSATDANTIVGGGLGIVSMLRLGEQPVLDSSDLQALEFVENRILNAKKVEKPAVAEWWHQLTKVIDKIHQHIMVRISDIFD